MIIELPEEFYFENEYGSSACNAEKSNMNQYEYQIWRTLGKGKSKYYQTIWIFA